MPGPAPKVNPVRRNARTGPMTLPAEGRKGDPPPWPIGAQTPDEAEIWADLWATPQSVAWEKLGWTRTVGRYARLLAEAEKPECPVTLLGEVRQLEDRLGLSPMAMRRLLWQVASDEVGVKRDEKASGDVRGRLRAVDSA